jgi:hypothetical protein
MDSSRFANISEYLFPKLGVECPQLSGTEISRARLCYKFKAEAKCVSRGFRLAAYTVDNRVLPALKENFDMMFGMI